MKKLLILCATLFYTSAVAAKVTCPYFNGIRGQADSGATSIRDCYISPQTVFTDATGSYIYPSGCTYNITDLEETLMLIVADHFSLDTEADITDQTNFQNDLGADFLDMVEIFMAIEDELHIELEYGIDGIYVNIETFKDLVDYVSDKLDSTVTPDPEPDPDPTPDPTPDPGPGVTAGEIQEEIMNLISELYNIPRENIALDSYFFDDLGMDELDYIELIMHVEDEYSIEIPDDKSQGFQKVKDLADYVVEHI